jgi:hypothetical protein
VRGQYGDHDAEARTKAGIRERHAGTAHGTLHATSSFVVSQRGWVTAGRLLVGASLVLGSRDAAADGFLTGAAPGKVEWKRPWDRFTPAEGAVTTLSLLAVYYVDARLPEYTEPKLDFEVPLVDPGARGFLRIRNEREQAVWSQWSDIAYRSMALFPYVVDSGVIALGVHRNPDVAAQLFLIDLEAFSLAALAQRIASKMTARPRPYHQDCADDGSSTRYTCGDNRDIRSFYAGHASAAFTAAGLTCLHHQHLPLWGGGGADAWACVWALSFASFTALSRITADEHWASDTVIGIGTGWFFGYLMPRWLHYGTKESRPYSLVGRVLPSRVAPSITPSGDGATFGLRGTL